MELQRTGTATDNGTGAAIVQDVKRNAATAQNVKWNGRGLEPQQTMELELQQYQT